MYKYRIYVIFGTLGSSYYDTEYKGFADQLFNLFKNQEIKTWVLDLDIDVVIDSFDPS